MIEINLVPDVKQELIKAQRIRSTVITVSVLIGIISVVVVILLAMYIYTIQAVRGVNVDEAIKNGSSALSAIEDLSNTLTIQNQLTKISDLNSQKKMYSRVFDLINKTNPKEPNNISISNLKIDSSSEVITIEGQALNSYAAVEVYKKTIEGSKLQYTDSSGNKQEIDLASNVNTSDTSYGENTDGQKVLRFTIRFAYASQLFSINSKDTSIYVTAKDNATDSFEGIPTSIFAERAKDLEEGQ